MATRLLALLAVVLQSMPALAADPLTAPTLRVCSDPDNPPFSTRSGEGFENALAAILGEALGRPVEHAWYPGGLGFVRQTLLRGRCDVILGEVRAHEGIALTRPYFTASHVLVMRAGEMPEGIGRIEDARLAGLAIGVVTGSPAATRLARAGMIGDARPYRPLLDRPNGAPAAEMLADLAAGRTDAVILWAPLARHFARVTGDGLVIAVLRDDGGRPALSHPVRLAVRRDEDAWRDLLDKVLAENEARIQAMLRDHGVLPDAAKPGG